MTPKELRAAAETVLDFYCASELTTQAKESVCQYILATVREDDGEPVAEEWFEKVAGDPLDLQTVEPWFIWWHSTRGLLMGTEGGSVGPEPLTLPVKTRGQFRKLYEGLGIVLEEKDQ